MIKSILACLAFLFSTNFLFAGEDLRLQPSPYTVIKDKKDPGIESGWFVISGQVKGFSSNLPIENVLVGCLSSGIWVRTDNQGKFDVKLKSTDQVIYFYKEGWSEVVIEDYTFKDQHNVELDVYLSQPPNNNVKRKPVIYLYADEDLEVNLQLDPKGEFTFTYPEYKNGWDATVNKDGGVEVEGKNYPYLFWEARSPNMTYKLENGKLPGYVLKSENVVAFFEEELTVLGLNQQEQTDFITYWGPLLSHREYAFIQFVVDDDYEEDIASIQINPAPDNMRRVFILCSGIDDPNLGIEVIPQELIGFERNGFTVVEWGGSIIDIETITP